MILSDDGTYDSMSEEEMEALEQVSMHRRVNEDEDDQVFCDNDSSPSLMVSKILTLQHLGRPLTTLCERRLSHLA